MQTQGPKRTLARAILSASTFWLLYPLDASATCWVRNGCGGSSDLNSLPGLLNSIDIYGASTAGCDAPDEVDAFYLFAIKFMTENYCTENPDVCTEYGYTGIIGNRVWLPDGLNLGGDVDVLIGNENAYGEFGTPVLDLRDAGATVDEIVSCDTSSEYAFRNVTIVTNGVDKETLFSAPCLLEEYDVDVIDTGFVFEDDVENVCDTGETKDPQCGCNYSGSGWASSLMPLACLVAALRRSSTSRNVDHALDS